MQTFSWANSELFSFDFDLLLREMYCRSLKPLHKELLKLEQHVSFHSNQFQNWHQYVIQLPKIPRFSLTKYGERVYVHQLCKSKHEYCLTIYQVLDLKCKAAHHQFTCTGQELPFTLFFLLQVHNSNFFCGHTSKRSLYLPFLTQQHICTANHSKVTYILIT